MGISEALGEGGRAERAGAGKARALRVERHLHSVLLTLLLLLQTDGKCTAHSVTQTFTCFLDSEEGVTQPAPSSAVTTDVRERLVVVPIGSAKRHFLNGLVNNQTLQTRTICSTSTRLSFIRQQ